MRINRSLSDQSPSHFFGKQAERLVSKAIAAGEFLLRMQLPDSSSSSGGGGDSSSYMSDDRHDDHDGSHFHSSGEGAPAAAAAVAGVAGDLRGSVFSTDSGNVTHPSNFAGTVCAVS